LKFESFAPLGATQVNTSKRWIKVPSSICFVNSYVALWALGWHVTDYAPSRRRFLATLRARRNRPIGCGDARPYVLAIERIPCGRASERRRSKFFGTSPNDFKIVASSKVPMFGLPLRLNARAPALADATSPRPAGSQPVRWALLSYRQAPRRLPSSQMAGPLQRKMG